MDPVLNSHFTKFKNAFEIAAPSGSSDEQQRQDAKAFEKFINYLLFSADYPDVFTADLELLDFVCVGGTNDTGIDGLGIKVNDRVIKNTDELLLIVGDSKKIRVEFVFIQTKLTSHMDIGEFNKFGLGVKNFFSEGYLPENEHLQEIRDIKSFIYSDQKVISKLDTNPKVSLYYVGVGQEPMDANYEGARRFLLSELGQSSCCFDTISIRAMGGKQIIKMCKELENQFEVQMNILDIFPLIVDPSADVKKSYSFTCRAVEFLKLLTKEDGTLRRSLFNDNVRDYLGKNAVNTEIENTISQSPEMFLLCNNGITIVCSDFDQVRDKLVKIENPQIVNGCQTSNAIFNLKSNPNIEKVQLVVRIISTENLGITNKIVRGTNKQNQVLDEAFEATLPFHQDVLEPYFVAIDTPIKLYYERRSKQYNNDPLIKKTQIVNLRILTQTFIAMFLDSPEQAHSHEAKLLTKYANPELPRRIFLDTHSPSPYYVCALTWYMFEKYFWERKIDYRYKPYKAQLYLIFRYTLGEYPPTLIKSKPIDSYCEKLVGLLTEPQFGNQVKRTLKFFDDTQAVWEQRGKSRYGIKDTKEFTDLLLERARKEFIEGVNQTIPDQRQLSQGTIMNVFWKNGVWFGFIDRGSDLENVYFDNRSYLGDVDRLKLNDKVLFEFREGLKGPYATSVVLDN